jgi:hypothetical protein
MVVVDAVEEDEYARGASTQDRSASTHFYRFIIVFHVFCSLELISHSVFLSQQISISISISQISAKRTGHKPRQLENRHLECPIHYTSTS